MIKKVKRHFHDVLKTKTTLHSIATGFAIGTFIEIFFPLPLVDFFIAFLVVVFFSKINKYSLFFALIFWNVLFIWPLFVVSFKIGDLLFGSVPIVKYDVVVFDKVYNFTRRFLVGNLIVASFVSFISYFLARFVVKFFRKKHGY